MSQSKFFHSRTVENNYDTNPYKLKDHGIPPSVLASLHDAALKHLYLSNKNYFITGRESVPNLASKTMSEIENCSKFLYPYINPIFCKRGKDYEVIFYNHIIICYGLTV
uniref:Uncharacterized protein n=1 Tax=Rhizophagus irregularis (strain DAOM 181602 / DAOM 197198 / MUCL 43194) TaxID=747089 RepID=U9TV51_RHIID